MMVWKLCFSSFLPLFPFVWKLPLLNFVCRVFSNLLNDRNLIYFRKSNYIPKRTCSVCIIKASLCRLNNSLKFIYKVLDILYDFKKVLWRKNNFWMTFCSKPRGGIIFLETHSIVFSVAVLDQMQYINVTFRLSF